MRKTMLFTIYSVLFAVSVIPSPASAQIGGCPVIDWWNDAGSYFIDFWDTVVVADVTGRGALSPVLIEMSRTRRAFQRAHHPDCLNDVVDAADAYMTQTIDVFIEFMGDSEYDAGDGFDNALDSLSEMLDALGELGYSLDVDAGIVCEVGTDCE